jgi:hypothetical protein
MTQAAANLTQTDVARLMALLTATQVKGLVRHISGEVRQGRLQWAPARRGQADEFGPSLARQVVNGGRLSAKQIAAAKGILLQRNWAQVVHCLTRDLVNVSDATLAQARQAGGTIPTYSRNAGAGTRTTRTQRRQARRRAQAQPVAAPAPVVEVCGKRLAYSSDRCTEPKGHRGACAGDARNAPQGPIRAVEDVLAGSPLNGRQSAAVVPQVRALPEPDPTADPSVQRFQRIILDDDAAPLPEPEVDASIERFRRLDLD